MQTTYLQNRNGLTHIENTFVIAEEEERGRRNSEFHIGSVMLLYMEWVNSKVQLCSAGNCIQYPVINHKRKEYKKGYMCVCINESFCLTAEINTTHQLDLNKIKFA